MDANLQTPTASRVPPAHLHVWSAGAGVWEHVSRRPGFEVEGRGSEDDRVGSPSSLGSGGPPLHANKLRGGKLHRLALLAWCQFHVLGTTPRVVRSGLEVRARIHMLGYIYMRPYRPGALLIDSHLRTVDGSSIDEHLISLRTYFL